MINYEVDVMSISDEVKDHIKSQIGDYSKYQDLIENGELYRLMTPAENDGKSAGYYVSENGKRILVYYYQQRGEEPREYRLKVKVENGTVWNATFNNYSPYHAFDLNTGIVVRSSAEDHYAQAYLFELNDTLKVKPISVGGVDSMYDRITPREAEDTSMFGKWLSDERMSDAAAAALAEKIRGHERFERITREFEYKKITTIEGDKEAYLFISDNHYEMFAFYYQPKGETPQEYRLRIDVPSSMMWTGTITRQSTYETENIYHGHEFYSGIIVRSSEEDGFCDIFHFIR